MSKQIRKRKHEENITEFEIFSPKSKMKFTDEESQAEEEQLCKILFGGTSSFLQSLEEAEQEQNTFQVDAIDSGVGETESDDSDKERKPAWHDEEDDGIDVREALKLQGRKLPLGGQNREGNQYTNLLKHKFTTIVGTPRWADLNKNSNKDDDSDSDDDILQTCGFIKKQPKFHLPQGIIETKKVLNLNKEMNNEGPYINAIEFHPTSSVGLVAGSSGIATLYEVNGKRNNKLHSVSFDKFPIRCARFNHDGNEAILSSNHRHVYLYDLISAKTNKIRLPDEITKVKNFIMSPDGKYIAIEGRFTEIHILSAISKEKLFTLNQNFDVTNFAFNSNGSLLFGHSDTGEVTIWDMNMRRVKHKFQDAGCLQGLKIDVSPSNQFLATGTGEGVVNLYDMEAVFNSPSPEPRKSILNLTTPVTDLRFNPTSEILSMSSRHIKNSIKLLHLGSNTVFSNFPNSQMRLGYVNVMNFSPGSGYFALGNCTSTVSLFRLKHFSSY